MIVATVVFDRVSNIASVQAFYMCIDEAGAVVVEAMALVQSWRH